MLQGVKRLKVLFTSSLLKLYSVTTDCFKWTFVSKLSYRSLYFENGFLRGTHSWNPSVLSQMMNFFGGNLRTGN